LLLLSIWHTQRLFVFV